MKTRDLLLEIGCEEIPAFDQQPLAQALGQSLCAALNAAQVATGEYQCFATPRRLAVLLRDVAEEQAERELLKRGPAVDRAFGPDGEPTPAALGFARACGADIHALERQVIDKGEFLVYREQHAGQPSQQVLQALIPQLVQRLPLRKRMRWGGGEASFVRPVHWILARFGTEVLPLNLFDLGTGGESRGHRIHHPGAVVVASPDDYPERLREAGVIADFEARRVHIADTVQRLAAEMDGIAMTPAQLLDEVCGLVEWPVVLAGAFEARHLELPSEVLTTVMMRHQRYFPVFRADPPQTLMNRFIFVANLNSRDPQAVVHGNSRVLRARLADAEFFWNEDRKTGLGERRPALADVLFQQGLGSLLDKSERLVRLAPLLAAAVNADVDAVRWAARLGKCDLLTGMVGEFPELQGIMGAYYALSDGKAPAVAAAIRDHYAPAGRSDAVPADAGALALALADKLDTLLGFFAIEQIPSGDKDPFGLRRAALGILRIVLESGIPLDLKTAIGQAAEAWSEQRAVPASAQRAVFNFILDRLRVHFREEGFAADLVEAVLGLDPPDPLDARKRLEALSAFRRRPEAEALAAANKRISNILRKENVHQTGMVAASRLEAPAERDLWTAWREIAPHVDAFLDQRDYAPALDLLAGLRLPVDRFFDDVMVMAEDPALRENRLALISGLRGAFLRIADFSLLQG